MCAAEADSKRRRDSLAKQGLSGSDARRGRLDVEDAVLEAGGGPESAGQARPLS
jgi:hypothetical protein